ncbi:peptidyl-prolyl cis-trans isomerase, partial [Candidatus Woesearchaeota archaeon]|nr:peptidyl-prolyl cis-trans isomerase [Candidatus Woesearchaeota archaeon]
MNKDSTTDQQAPAEKTSAHHEGHQRHTAHIHPSSGKKRSFHPHKLKISAVLLLVLGLLVLLSILTFQFNKPPEGAVAKVYDTQITKDQLASRTSLLSRSGVQLSQPEVLNQTIIELLLLREAKAKGISVSEEQLSNLLRDFLTAYNMTQDDFTKKLSAQGLTLADFTTYYQHQLTIAQLLNQTVLSSIVIDPIAVQAYYDQNSALFIGQQGKIRARYISYLTEAEAQQALHQLKQGTSFDVLVAALEPLGRAGDLGFFGKRELVPDVEAAAFALQINQYSNAVSTQSGYVIVQRETDT